MLKAGIYVDAENISRCGGWGMKYEMLKRFVQAQDARVLRANVYIAHDRQREEQDRTYRIRREAYRGSLRALGFKVVNKETKRFYDEDGTVITKANADLELAIDAILQGQRLDYLVIVSGDGDFVRLINALQNMGCRVDVIGFHYTARSLRDAADHFYSGFLIPDLMPTENGRMRGYLHYVDEDKYFGWLTIRGGFDEEDVSSDVFLHGNDLEDGTYTNTQFAYLRQSHIAIEFDLVVNEQGQPRAENAVVVKPEVG